MHHHHRHHHQQIRSDTYGVRRYVHMYAWRVVACVFWMRIDGRTRKMKTIQHKSHTRPYSLQRKANAERVRTSEAKREKESMLGNRYQKNTTRRSDSGSGSSNGDKQHGVTK